MPANLSAMLRSLLNAPATEFSDTRPERRPLGRRPRRDHAVSLPGARPEIVLQFSFGGCVALLIHDLPRVLWRHEVIEVF